MQHTYRAMHSALLAAVGLFAAPAFAQVATEDAVIESTSFVGSDFGYSVDIDGDRLAVGDVTSVVGLALAGRVHVRERLPSGQWGVAVSVVPPDPSTNMFFGAAVDIEGDRLVVGAPLAGPNSPGFKGAVYVFARQPNGTWQFEVKLQANGGVGSYSLGQAVAQHGDRIVASGAGLNQVVVFERSAGGIWSELTSFGSPLPTSNSRFGAALDIDGSRIVVGEPRSSIHGTDAGAAWAFVENSGTYVFDAEIAPALPSANAQFGTSIALDGDRVVVGAAFDDMNAIQAGAAHVIERSPGGTWDPVARLDADQPIIDQRFGSSVALRGDFVLVGTDAITNNFGSLAETFVRTSNGAWVAHARLGSSNRFTTAGRPRGGPVAMSDDLLVCGAREGDVFPQLSPPSTAGTVSFYERRTMLHGQHAISISGGNAGGGTPTGSTQDLLLRLGDSWAGAVYFIGGSVTGTGPTSFGSLLVPLTYDAYSNLSLNLGLTMVGQVGALDALGRANPVYFVPPGTSPSFAGLFLYHAAVVIDTTTFASTVTNATLCVLYP